MAKPNIFLSYSHKDSDIANALIKELSREGLDVWSDRSITPGSDWKQEIEDALRRANYYLILLTPNFLASEWNNVEMGVALSRRAESEGVRIIPILLKDVRVPIQLSSLHYLDGREVAISKIGEKISELIKE